MQTLHPMKRFHPIGGDCIYTLLPGVSLSRITPPTVPPQFILRKSILEALDKPAPQAFIAIAPSGFGKTILAAQWAAMHPDRTIWYTPDLTDSFKDLVVNQCFVTRCLTYLYLVLI